jgi:hypothetical protein
MSISAIVPVDDVADANATLRDAGFGEENFRVPLRTGDGETTHVGLHCWDKPEFLSVIQTLPSVEVKTDGSHVNFAEAAAEQAVEWSDPTNWFENPVMKGDTRTFNNKTWISLVDYNVWTPPTAWREVSENPEWVQPTGSSDAYPLDFTVTHNSQIWRSTINANVWEPGVVAGLWELVDQGGGDTGNEEWVDTGATVAQLVAAGVYRVSTTLPDLIVDQQIKLGDQETVFKGFWSNNESYLLIDPHVTVDVGAIVYKWA